MRFLKCKTTWKKMVKQRKLSPASLLDAEILKQRCNDLGIKEVHIGKLYNAILKGL